MKTKAIFTGMLALILSATVVKAQLGSHVGVTVGPSFSTFYGNGASDNLRTHGGFVGGFVYQYAFSASFALHTGLLYESKGASDEYSIGPLDFRGRYNFNYLAIPILFRAHLMPEKRVRPFINAGPYLGFLTRQKSYLYEDNDEISSNVDTDNYRRFDIGVSGGIGVDFLIGEKMHLDFELRDNLGLMNISESDNSSNRFSNNSVNFLVTAIFSIP